MDFSEYLRFTRLFHGLTQKEIASRLGYTQALISEVENKRKHPSTRLKVALTREFPRTIEFERFLIELKMEMVTLDDNYSVTMVTTQLMEGVQLITCADECEATLMINDQDINLVYTTELASIIGNLNDYTAEQLLLALAQVDRLAT